MLGFTAVYVVIYLYMRELARGYKTKNPLPAGGGFVYTVQYY